MDVDLLLEYDRQSELDSDHAQCVQPQGHVTNASDNEADSEPQPGTTILYVYKLESFSHNCFVLI